MHKAITPVISVILLILITIIASTSAYFFITSTMTDLEGGVDISGTPMADNSRLRIVSLSGSKAIISNEGTGSINEVIVLLNGEAFNYTFFPALSEGDAAEIDFSPQLVGEDLEIKILYGRGKTVEYTSPAKFNTADAGFIIDTTPIVILASIVQNITQMKGYCQASVYNASLDSVYYYEWLLNEVFYSSGSAIGNHDNENYLLSTITSTNGSWKFKCLVSNGTLNSTWKESSQKSINTPLVFLTSIVDNHTQLLGHCQASIYNLSIASVYYYEWLLNGSVYSSGSASGNHDYDDYLLNNITLSNGSWMFKCLVGNGTYNSTWEQSSQLALSNCWAINGVCNSSCNYSARSEPALGYLYGDCGVTCPRTAFNYSTFSGECSPIGSGSCYMRAESLGSVYTGCAPQAGVCGTCGGSASCSSFGESQCGGCSDCGWVDFFGTWLCYGTISCIGKGFTSCTSCGCLWEGSSEIYYYATGAVAGYAPGYQCTWMD